MICPSGLSRFELTSGRGLECRGYLAETQKEVVEGPEPPSGGGRSGCGLPKGGSMLVGRVGRLGSTLAPGSAHGRARGRQPGRVTRHLHTRVPAPPRDLCRAADTHSTESPPAPPCLGHPHLLPLSGWPRRQSQRRERELPVPTPLTSDSGITFSSSAQEGGQLGRTSLHPGGRSGSGIWET